MSSSPSFPARPQLAWQLRTRTLALGARTLVMGIVNVTPDSFSGDGVQAGARDAREAQERAVAQGLRMLEEGAALLDVGGESTRPGAGPGSAEQEQERVLPVIEALLRERPDAVLSVDTWRAATARAAVAAGVEIVNDVSGFEWDSGMAAACAALQCGVVLTHTRGRPEQWHTLPALLPGEVAPLVESGLRARVQAALDAGVRLDQVVLDPGYGFGKAWEANYALLHGQARLLELGRPVLAGVSRKGFLGRTLSQAPGHALGRELGGGDVPVHGREAATLAAAVAAVLNGASVLRMHAVRPAVEAAAIADAVLSAGEPLLTP